MQKMDKHLLLIPFHFPPIQGSTGSLRSLAFARWLPESEWRVTVLTANQRAYPMVAAENDLLVAPSMTVIRGFAIDARRHLSFRGRYLKFMALPDRWVSWVIGAVWSGLRIIRNDRPDMIYTTYPIPSSHLIGFLLHKITGVPWVAEFRDPMVEVDYPADRTQRRIRVWIEMKIFKHARRIVVVTPSAKEYYAARSRKDSKFVVEIPNGFDEILKADEYRDDTGNTGHSAASRPINFLHSGILYGNERNPDQLFVAIADLKASGFFDKRKVKFVFRGSGSEDDFEKRVSDLGINELVEFRKSVSYREARHEMLQADVLLLLQGRVCNRQIPAKLYEYLALRKAVLCLADPAGDTASQIKSLGLGESAPLEDSDAIKSHLSAFISEYLRGSPKLLDDDALAVLSRRSRAKELASLLDEAVCEKA